MNLEQWFMSLKPTTPHSFREKGRTVHANSHTNNVASVNGTWTCKDRNNALNPPALKPIRFPVYDMLLATSMRCSTSTPFVTILKDVDSRCKNNCTIQTSTCIHIIQYQKYQETKAVIPVENISQHFHAE